MDTRIKKKDDITPDAVKKQSENKDLESKFAIAKNATIEAFIKKEIIDTISFKDFEKLEKDIHNMRNDNNISSNSILAAVNTGVLNIKDYIKTRTSNEELEKNISSILELSKHNFDNGVSLKSSIDELGESLLTKEDIDRSIENLSTDLSDKLVSQNQLQIDNYNGIIELLNLINCNNGGIDQSVKDLSFKISNYMSDMEVSNTSIINKIIDINKNMQSMDEHLTMKFYKKASTYLNKIIIAIILSGVSAITSIVTLLIVLFSWGDDLWIIRENTMMKRRKIKN